MVRAVLWKGEPVSVPVIVVWPFVTVAELRTGAGWRLVLVGWAMPPAVLL